MSVTGLSRSRRGATAPGRAGVPSFGDAPGLGGGNEPAPGLGGGNEPAPDLGAGDEPAPDLGAGDEPAPGLGAGDAQDGATSLAARPLGREFYAGDAREVARSLVGKLVVRDDGRVARLVEVEAYMGMDDPGSHAFRGPTPRAAIMFGPAGHLYVYFSYGMHWCANVVCGPEGMASAVLLRAAEPLARVAAMRLARTHGQKVLLDRDLCRGPGRLTEAFGITGEMNGADLVPPDMPAAKLRPVGPSTTAPGAGRRVLWLADDGAAPPGPVVATPRVGLSAARAPVVPWRYVVAGSPWASGPASR